MPAAFNSRITLSIDFRAVRAQLQRSKEHTCDFARDALPAELERLFLAARVARVGVRPEQRVCRPGAAAIAWQIGSKISVSPRFGMISPNTRPSPACGVFRT